MIINRQHWVWAAFVIVASVVATLFYVGEFYPERLPLTARLPASLHRDVRETGRSVGGTPLGLIYGSIAAAIFVFAALLGLRRKRPTLKVGRLQVWLKGHIWLTILTIPLVLLHCGFSSGSPMTRWFLAIYGIVMLSGFYGLALQHFLPRLMKERVPLETIFEQIPHLRSQMRESALELRKSLEPAPAPAPVPITTTAAPATSLATAGIPAVAEPLTSTAATSVTEVLPDPSIPVFREFMDEAALPYLSAHRGEKLLLGSQRVSDDQFRLLKISVGNDWQARLEQLQAWCDERRQLDLQTKLQHWLHGWLLVHIPFSVLLLVFTTWHVIAALFFY
ncbi:MAG TPA: hypothetical protein VK846_04215 [Candidatus Limnocylindria bacterium]|nr:hypothetical protein [Candidatus Limnocylindria bacterium]